MMVTSRSSGLSTTGTRGSGTGSRAATMWCHKLKLLTSVVFSVWCLVLCGCHATTAPLSYAITNQHGDELAVSEVFFRSMQMFPMKIGPSVRSLPDEAGKGKVEISMENPYLVQVVLGGTQYCSTVPFLHPGNSDCRGGSIRAERRRRFDEPMGSDPIEPSVILVHVHCMD